MLAVIGALVVLSTEPPPHGRSWTTAVLPLVAGGAVLTSIAIAIGEHPIPAALLAGVVRVAATLPAGLSEKASIPSLIATLRIILPLQHRSIPTVPRMQSARSQILSPPH